MGVLRFCPFYIFECVFSSWDDYVMYELLYASRSGWVLRNRHVVPLSSQRFTAFSVSSCSGHRTRYTSCPAIPYHGWRTRIMRGGIRNIALCPIGNL